MEWNIGENAQQLDKMSIKERMRIEKRSIKKVLVAVGIYFITIGLFALLL